MARTKWTDERLDDLAKLVFDNDGRLDQVQTMANDSGNSIKDMLKRDALSSRSPIEQIAIAAALASPAVTLILGIVYHGH